MPYVVPVHSPGDHYNSWIQQHGAANNLNLNNPNPGQFDQPNSQPDYGGGQGDQSKPVTVPSGDDYKDWNWEETLDGVLGLALPARTDVTSQEWIAIDFNTSGGTGMYRIFAATWYDDNGGNKDTFVYLNPNLLTPGGIWDNYFFSALECP